MTRQVLDVRDVRSAVQRRTLTVPGTSRLLRRSRGRRRLVLSLGSERVTNHLGREPGRLSATKTGSAEAPGGPTPSPRWTSTSTVHEQPWTLCVGTERPPAQGFRFRPQALAASLAMLISATAPSTNPEQCRRARTPVRRILLWGDELREQQSSHRGAAGEEGEAPGPRSAGTCCTRGLQTMSVGVAMLVRRLCAPSCRRSLVAATGPAAAAALFSGMTGAPLGHRWGYD